MARKKKKGSLFLRRPLPGDTKLGLPFYRVVLMAILAVLACVYGIVSAIRYERKPMFVPAPPATEIPAPDLER